MIRFYRQVQFKTFYSHRKLRSRQQKVCREKCQVNLKAWRWRAIRFYFYKVHISILRRLQNFVKSPLYFWLALHRTKVRGRFCKILWPSQNIWTLVIYEIVNWMFFWKKIYYLQQTHSMALPQWILKCEMFGAHCFDVVLSKAC